MDSYSLRTRQKSHTQFLKIEILLTFPQNIGTAVDISVDCDAVFTNIQTTMHSLPTKFTVELLHRIIHRQLITNQNAAFWSVGFLLFDVINTVFTAEKRKLLPELSEWNLNEILVVWISQIYRSFELGIISYVNGSYIFFYAVISNISGGLPYDIPDTVISFLRNSVYSRRYIISLFLRNWL